jgi:hypothetical protein
MKVVSTPLQTIQFGLDRRNADDGLKRTSKPLIFLAPSSFRAYVECRSQALHWLPIASLAIPVEAQSETPGVEVDRNTFPTVASRRNRKPKRDL